MILFGVALTVLFANSLPWVAVAKTSNKTNWLLAFYLIASANVILSCYIANSLLLLNRVWFLLLLHTVIGGIGWLLWQRAGKPSVWGAFEGWQANFKVQLLKRDPALLALTVGISIFYTFAFAQVIFIPQNNVDSLAAHLSRIGFWLQHGSFFPWQTFMPSQVWYPVNAQLQTYWTLLFLGNDRLVGSVQWLAALVSGLGVFGLARIFGYGERQSKFAALIFLSFPLVALQATTTQTDLMTVAFFIPAIYFLMAGVKEDQNSLLILSALGLGIGIGIKKSYFVLLPVLTVTALLLLFQFGRKNFRRLVIWSFVALISIAIFGAYMYIFNCHYWGDPFGAPGYVENMLQTSRLEKSPFSVQVGSSRQNLRMVSADLLQNNLGRDIISELAYNIPRLMFQALDTSGLPRPLDGYAHKIKARATRTLFDWLGFSEIEGTSFTAPGHEFNFDQKNENEESHAWYGPLSVLLIFPALIKKSWQGIRQRSPMLLIPIVSLLIFLPFEIIFRPGWDPYQGRYFAPIVALCTPFMSEWFKQKDSARYEWIWGGMAMIFVAVTMLYNPSKPTLGKFADDFHVWNNRRSIIQTMQRKNDRAVYEMVEQYVPENVTLGYYIPFFFMEYPLFGKNVDRHLATIMSPEQITDDEWLHDQGVEYLLIPNQSFHGVVPADYPIHATIYGWTIYARVPTP